MANLAGIKETNLVVKAVVAGQDGSVVSSSAIDCESKNRVCFELLTSVNTATGTIDMAIVQDNASDGDFTDEVKKVVYATGGTDDTIYQLDVPITKRYVKTVHQRKVANTTILAGTLSVYDAKKLPTAQTTAVKGRTIV